MKMQRIAVIVTIVNFVLMVFLLAQLHPARAQQNEAPVLRGRALEIVDNSGNMRAAISVEPPVIVDGKQYPQTVLLRMFDANKSPVVKLTAAENGGGFGLSDNVQGGIQILARKDGSFMKVKTQGKEQVIKP